MYSTLYNLQTESQQNLAQCQLLTIGFLTEIFQFQVMAAKTLWSGLDMHNCLLLFIGDLVWQNLLNGVLL